MPKIDVYNKETKSNEKVIVIGQLFDLCCCGHVCAIIFYCVVLILPLSFFNFTYLFLTQTSSSYVYFS